MLEFVEPACVNDAKHDVIDPQPISHQNEETRGHHTHFEFEGREAIIVQFVLIERQFVIEQDGIIALEEIVVNLIKSGMQHLANEIRRMDGSRVGCGKCPVDGIVPLLNVLWDYVVNFPTSSCRHFDFGHTDPPGEIVSTIIWSHSRRRRSNSNISGWSWSGLYHGR